MKNNMILVEFGLISSETGEYTIINSIPASNNTDANNIINNAITKTNSKVSCTFDDSILVIDTPVDNTYVQVLISLKEINPVINKQMSTYYLN